MRVEDDGKREKAGASLLSIIPRELPFGLFSARDTNNPPRMRDTSSVSSLCLSQCPNLCPIIIICPTEELLMHAKFAPTIYKVVKI